MKLALLLSVLLVLNQANIAKADQPKLAGSRPNIIIILADDVGYSDIGCFGGEIETPNLDALAQTGIRFTQFYNTARCCPTRAALLTGLYAHQAGIGHMVDGAGPKLGAPAYSGELSQHAVTIAEVLKSSGYSSYVSGSCQVQPIPTTAMAKAGQTSATRPFANTNIGSTREESARRSSHTGPMGFRRNGEES